MANIEPPITLEEQVMQMKKYVSFRQRKKMREFLEYVGYFRASRYGKFLLSRVGVTGAKSKEDALFALYKFDVELRRILNFYCNRTEVRFKSALSNACSIKLNSGTFYLDKQSYTPSQGEKDAKKRKQNIAFFNNYFYKDILDEAGNVTGQETTKDASQATDYLIGDALPSFYGGLGTSLSYSGFDFSINLNYQLGGKAYDYTYQT